MIKNMESEFYIISFNYKNIPLEERENFIRTGYKNILKKYLEKKIIKGYVAIETCLRIELYLDIEDSIEIPKRGDNFSLDHLKKDFKTKNMKIYTGKEAIKYLLKVICGLESVIKGEDQILSQLKKAYLFHLKEGTTSTLINIIFNQAIETGKKFRNKSKINEKNISLDSIAVKFIKSKIESLENKKIFVIGVGDLSQSILALLHKIYSCNLTMTNRSIRKSIELKKIFEGIEMVEFKQKYEVIKRSDIIISATSAPHLILIKEEMREILNDGKSRFFLDLAVPRDIDVDIKADPFVSLYHLDDIWEEYNKNVEKRDEIVKKYFYVIDDQLNKIEKKIEKRNKYVYGKECIGGVNDIE